MKTGLAKIDQHIIFDVQFRITRLFRFSEVLPVSLAVAVTLSSFHKMFIPRCNENEFKFRSSFIELLVLEVLGGLRKWDE